FLGNIFSQQRLHSAGAELIEIFANAENDFLRIEYLAGVKCRAKLRATAALHARVGLERNQLGDVLTGIQAEIVIVGQRWNFAESVTARENRHRAQQQMQVLGVRDQRQETEQRERMQPPVHPAGNRAFFEPERGQI